MRRGAKTDETIFDEIDSLRTMRQVLIWAKSRTPPPTFVNAVT
jgi:hypothetical protein